MNQQNFSVYYHKSNELASTTIRKFREHLNLLQIRLNDFTYFHENDEDDKYHDLTKKSKELFENTEKIISKILDFLSANDNKGIIIRDDVINYISDIYKSLKDKNSIFLNLYDETKELYKSRNPEDFNEICNISHNYLELLGIELNVEEEKQYKIKIEKIFKGLREDNDSNENFELSEERENLLGQFVSEICLCNSIKMLKKSKSAFKINAKKVDKAFKTENETFCMNMLKRLDYLYKENENLKEANQEYETKLKNAKIENEELQNLINEKNEQNKKLSDRIMELDGSSSSPDIIFNLASYSDDLDESVLSEIEANKIEASKSQDRAVNITPPASNNGKEKNICAYEESLSTDSKRLTIPKRRYSNNKKLVSQSQNEADIKNKNDNDDNNDNANINVNVNVYNNVYSNDNDNSNNNINDNNSSNSDNGNNYLQIIKEKDEKINNLLKLIKRLATL